MNNKKDLAIVFGITKDLDFALATVLFGIKEHFSFKNYDIIVYHNGLSEERQKFLCEIMPCQFILYKNNLKETDFDKACLALYSNMCLARFECFDLLKKYKKIIWHDVDILIQKDFVGLLDYANKTGLAMTYNDIGFLTEANFNSLIENYNMFLPLINSGIIVFSDILKDYDKMKDWCYNKVKELNVKLRYIDQGILNILVQEFKINVEPINISKYCCHPARKNSKNAVIVHTYGYDKFWNANYLQEKFPVWSEYLISWAKIIRNYYNKAPKNPVISVVMSIYNRTAYLDDAINSILNQTYGNFELIIVVEYSDYQKELNDILSKYKDKRIVIINNKEKLGFAASLNVGIKMAKGKYVARMDDDDIALPLRFEKQLKFLESNPDVSVVGTAIKTFMGDSREIYPQMDSEIIKTYTLINNQMYHPTVMFRKNDLMKHNLFYSNDYKTEDAELWSRVVKYLKMANMKDILLKYRVNGENETAIAKESVFMSDVKIIQKQLKENLNINLSLEDCMYLSGRISKYGYIFNRGEIFTKRNKLIKKVIKQNNKFKYYNKKYLRELFELNNESVFKKIVKKMIRPIYSRLMYRIETMVDGKMWNFKNENL